MIGIDTNILVRLVVVDNTAQHERAVRFFSQRSPEDPAFIPLVVIVEAAWVLERRYKLARSRVLEVFHTLLDTIDVVIDQPDLVATALAHADTPKIDIADALIAQMNARNGCEKTLTFDKNAARLIDGMDLLS